MFIYKCSKTFQKLIFEKKGISMKTIGTGIDEKGNLIMAANIQYLNEEKTLYRWLTQEPYWLSHVWKTVNGSL